MPRPQRNVQQQTATLRKGVERCASSLGSAAPWLFQVLAQRGLRVTDGILAALRHAPEQEGDFFSGIWLSHPSTFWAFHVVVAREPNGAVTVERFEDVSSQTVVSEHLPGTGASFGAVALQVLASRRVAS